MKQLAVRIALFCRVTWLHMSGGWFDSSRGKKSSLFHAPATLYSMDNDALSMGIKQPGITTTHYLHLLLTLRMSGGIPPLSHMPSWHERGRLYLHYEII
jgi:hypothetical protein